MSRDDNGSGAPCPRCDQAMAEFMGLPLIVDGQHISRGQRICCACGLVDPWDTSAGQAQLLAPSRVPARKMEN